MQLLCSMEKWGEACNIFIMCDVEGRVVIECGLTYQCAHVQFESSSAQIMLGKQLPYKRLNVLVFSSGLLR